MLCRWGPDGPRCGRRVRSARPRGVGFWGAENVLKFFASGCGGPGFQNVARVSNEPMLLYEKDMKPLMWRGEKCCGRAEGVNGGCETVGEQESKD